MSSGIAILALIATMFLLLATGLPVVFAIGGTVIVLTLVLWGVGGLANVAYMAWAGMSQFILVAIPLFILMGFILQRSGLAERIYRSLHMWLGFLPGGLAIATVALCTLMAAMVGTVGAGLVTAGVISIPEMRRYNYNRRITYGSIMAGGGLGVLIPPSVIMLFYAGISRMSVGKMFAGGIFPGLILSSLYMLYIGIRAHFNPSLCPALPPEQRGTLREKIVAMKDSFLAAILIIMVLGSIFAGITTPTEAASVGCLGALVISAIYRKLSWTVIKTAVYETGKILGMIVWILIAANCFSQLFLVAGAQGLIEKLVFGFVGSRWVILISILLSLVVFGMFLDDWVIVIIFVPIYTPIIIELGFDQLWFALLFMLIVQTALLTPPYGFALYYMRTLVPEEGFAELVHSILPFFGMQIIGIAICMAFPEVILWLPSILITA